MNSAINLRWPAITCVHVVVMDAPVLSVSHDEPACDGDSGWAFTYGQEGHPNSELMVVGIGTVLKHDASVEELLLMPRGYWAYRSDLNEEWIIEPL